MDILLPHDWSIVDFKTVNTSSGTCVRELSTFRGGRCQTWLFHWSENDEGGDYDRGLDPQSFYDIISKVTANSSFVFVQGSENFTFLKNFLQNDVIDLNCFKYRATLYPLSKFCPFNVCWSMAQWLFNFVQFENERWIYVFDNAPLRMCSNIEERFAPFSSYEKLDKVRDPYERLKKFISCPSKVVIRFWNEVFGSSVPTTVSI